MYEKKITLTADALENDMYKRMAFNMHKWVEYYILRLCGFTSVVLPDNNNNVPIMNPEFMWALNENMKVVVPENCN